MTRAIILAAGSGSRLMPLTADRPKGMVTFQGETLLGAQLSVLRAWGIEDITLVGGYRAEALSAFGLPVICNERFETTNMVASLMCARDLIDGRDDLVISYADIVYEPRVLQAVLDGDGDLVVAADRNWLDLWQARLDDPLADAETFRVRKDGTLAELGRKPGSIAEVEGQYIGLIGLPARRQQDLRAVYDALDPSALYEGRPIPSMFMTALIQHLIDIGWAVRPAWISSGWLEIDTMDDFARYDALARTGRLDRLYRRPKPLETESLRVLVAAAIGGPRLHPARGEDPAARVLAALQSRAWLDREELASLDGLARKIEISGRLPLAPEAIDALLAAYLLAYAQTRDLRHLNTVLKALDGTLKSPRPSVEAEGRLRQWCAEALA